MKTIRWGILGPGRISGTFAEALREAAGASLVAVGSRDLGRATAFAAAFGATNVYDSYEALVTDPMVDAIYIGTPHTYHCEHALLCLRGGKHVLCEKPIAVNAVQAGRMFSEARSAGLVLMEAMWTRFLPAVIRARELVEAGMIGAVRTIVADFGFRAEFDPRSRLFDPDLGGGSLLDLGIYPLNLAFMIGGAPLELHATAILGATGVDEQCAILLRHQGGVLSILSASLCADTPREATIFGSEGSITLCRPWWGATRIVLRPRDGREETMDLPGRGGGYAHEAEAFMDLIRTGTMESDIMPASERLAIIGTMDEIRERWGMTYPCESSRRGTEA